MAFEGSLTFSYIFPLRLFVVEKTTSISYLYSPITPRGHMSIHVTRNPQKHASHYFSEA
jgi:hypothetical protein